MLLEMLAPSWTQDTSGYAFMCVCDGFVFDGYGQYVSFVLLAEDRVIIVMHNHA